MTPELSRRLERTLPPFDGDCIHNLDDLSLRQLRLILVTAMGELQQHFPVVYSFHDWHEHDGFVVDSRTDDWRRIRGALESDWSLFESRDDDFTVRIAFHPPTFEWLLRYNIDSEDEADYRTASCDFDLTVSSQALVNNVLDRVAAVGQELLARCSAAPWFRSTDGG